jgi:hypothetical protein
MRPISKALRFRILARDGFKCRYCGAKAPDVHLRVDHFIARADGGGNGEENLVTACFDCNAGKSDRKITGLRNPIVNVTNRRGRLTKKTDPRNRALDQVRKGELNHHVLNTGAVIETGRILGDKQFANVWCESHQEYEWHPLDVYWVGRTATTVRLHPVTSRNYATGEVGPSAPGGSC